MAQYQNEPKRDPITLVEEATFDFTLGDNDEALRKLNSVVEQSPECFEAWHALTEVYFSTENYEDALKAAEKAYAINKEDTHINTSLSRIWMEKGNKEMAEHFGAQARMLGWKEQINEPEGDEQDEGLETNS